MNDKIFELILLFLAIGTASFVIWYEVQMAKSRKDDNHDNHAQENKQ